MNTDELTYVVALQQVSKVGPVIAKSLLAYCGSAAEVFKAKKNHLLKIPGVGKVIAENVATFRDFKKAEEEVAFAQKHQIRMLFFLDKDYPQRMRDLPDAPLILYYKGEADLNRKRVMAIVGTRRATAYGKAACARIVEELMPYSPLIVSGLAYGIDYEAHRTSLKTGLPTVGVLGHGLDQIYPAAHRSLAVKMVKEGGGLLTEYPSGTLPDSKNFPARNRIVAGMVDGLLVVESSRKGGALITAEIANSYNRDVFAVPGRVEDEYSSGCNYFIRVNKASLVETADDIAYNLGWDEANKKKKAVSAHEKMKGLVGMEKDVAELLNEKEKVGLDTICTALNSNLTEISLLLLDMEFKGIIQALPGKYYRLA